MSKKNPKKKKWAASSLKGTSCGWPASASQVEPYVRHGNVDSWRAPTLSEPKIDLIPARKAFMARYQKRIEQGLLQPIGRLTRIEAPYCAKGVYVLTNYTPQELGYDTFDGSDSPVQEMGIPVDEQAWYEALIGRESYDPIKYVIDQHGGFVICMNPVIHREAAAAYLRDPVGAGFIRPYARPRVSVYGSSESMMLGQSKIGIEDTFFNHALPHQGD